MTPVLLNMDNVKVDPAWALRVPASLAFRRQVLPFAMLDGQVYVAVADPTDSVAVEAIERFTGQRVAIKVADRESLQRALTRVYGDSTRPSARISLGPGTVGAIVEPDRDDAVTLSSDLLHAAILRQASDIHIEPGRDTVRVRFRVDGVLEEYQRLPLTCEAGLISRFKVLAGMDIAEKRAPQDGSFTHRYGSGANGRLIDIRTATLPTKYGERITLRLLGVHADVLTLPNLGMSLTDLQIMERVLDQPHGLVLLTGPTGSGKSTTLYAAIHKLVKSANLNIITIEDPIEYDIPGVAQVEVDSAEKVSFGKALRSVLRHDPDVLMIGEIRDMDTLSIAVKSALTGHLVLSTLHTNSAPSAITRLADMGLERYMIAATLRLCVAQRLVRKLCAQCRVARPLGLTEAATMGRRDLEGATVYDAGGCIYCAGRGYVGRIGLFELLAFDSELGVRVTAGDSEAQLAAVTRERKQSSLMDDAVEKVLAGLTTVREVLQSVMAG